MAQPASKRLVTEAALTDPESPAGAALNSTIAAAIAASRDSIMVSPAIADGVSDAAPAIQAALDEIDAAGGGVVRVPPAANAYLLGSHVSIGSNTTLDATGATLRRNNSGNHMAQNKSDGTIGAYAASSNITVVGGTWDGNRVEFPNSANIFAFGHATKLVIRDAVLSGVQDWHHIEVNACQDVLITGCSFLDGIQTSGGGQEAVQIDSATNAGAFLYFGPYDSTPCKNVTVRDCSFDGVQRGIGNHADAAGVWHSGITVTNCSFRNIADLSIDFVGTRDGRISGCKFEASVWRPIRVWTNLQTARSSDWVITGNGIRGLTATSGEKYPMDIRNADRCVISGNVIASGPDHGIVLGGSDGSKITDNIITVNQAPIYSLNSKNITISGNRCVGLSGSSYGRINVGTYSGSDHTKDLDIVISGNVSDSITVWTGSRISVVGNNVTGALTVGSGAGVGKANNFVNGTWVP